MDVAAKAQLPPNYAACMERIGCNESGKAVTLTGRWDKTSRLTVKWLHESERESSDLQLHGTVKKIPRDAVWMVLEHRHTHSPQTPFKLTICWTGRENKHTIITDSTNTRCFAGDVFDGCPANDNEFKALAEWLDSSLTPAEAQTPEAKRRHWYVDNVRTVRCCTYGSLTSLACAALYIAGRKRLSPQNLRRALLATALVGGAVATYRAWDPVLTPTRDPKYSIGEDSQVRILRGRNEYRPRFDCEMWSQIRW